MKVILVSNQARSMAVFWRVLIEAMRERGMEVVCCVPAGDPVSEAALGQMGGRVVNYQLDRKGINPLRDYKTFRELRAIFASEKPDLLFATTIKPVIYGCMAAARSGVANIFPTITGLGYVFESDSLFKKLINRIARFLYRKSLKYAKGVFFQNTDDISLFRDQEILDQDSPVLLAAGTGVDTSHFEQAPLPPATPVVFLLVARLLEAKGIADYVAAARILRQKYPEARFQLLGPPESGAGSLPLAQVERWQAEGLIEYLGQTADVRPRLAAAHVVVLPSWREGLPTSLMEAMSVGRPLVATDVPGCRSVVEEGENGFLVPAHDPAALASAMERFIVNPGLIAIMGGKSRRQAVERFDAHRVAEGILNDMTRLAS